MRTYKFALVIFFLAIINNACLAQSDTDSTGLPGDQFDLHGVLAMFKQAKSIEAFEQAINTKDNNINNLDLNEDGDVDYVKVIDKTEKNVHAFVLQVPISENENQDVAVIELEKTGDTTAVLQIIGDEDIYGEMVIVEAGDEDDEAYEKESNNGRGPSIRADMAPFAVVINVWSWPSVRFVYSPIYRPWISPWRWRVYPTWYRPWRPLAWHTFHPFRARYHVGFRTVSTHRVVVAHRVYTPHRTTSVTVRTRHSAKVNNYRVTRTTRTTKVKGPRGGEVKVKHSKTKVKKTKGRR